MALAAVLALGGPAAASADSGSISGIHDVGGGQLEATFSATGNECTPSSYCGWYAYARQAPTTSICSTGNSDLVWVGPLHSSSSSETTTARFSRKYAPTKLCLIVHGANGEHVVAEVAWTPPPPGLISPGAGERLTTRRSVTFVGSDSLGSYREVQIEIARSSGTDPDGTLANSEQLELGTEYTDSSSGFEYGSEGSWSQQPGTYYWQIERLNCGKDPSCNSEIRSLTIVEPPLHLSVAARSRQRLKAGYNNLVVRLKCNIECRTRLTARPYYRRNGRRVGLPALAFHSTFDLPRGRSETYGFKFTRAERARLTDMMHRYGPILWALEYRAASGPGDVDRATDYVRMVPPPRPAPPPRRQAPPLTNCQGYSPCLPPGPDVDCAGGSGNGPRYVNGPVRVYGSDPYGLDNDGDGVGCE